jgi:hypothetical protein
MKTGFDAYDNTLANTIKETGADLLNRLLIYAIENACVYAKSAGRENMTGQDIIIALQYEAHEFPYRNYNNENDEESSDEDDDDCESIGETGDEEADVFTKSYSNDPLIEKMNYYHETWDSWNPDIPIEITLKNAVDNAMGIYK